MRILIYGAGNIGVLYAAKLRASGDDVSILARGKRAAEIREHGIVLEEFGSQERTTTRVEVIEQLDPDDAYDLVFVILPKNHVAEVLPILAANRRTPSVMFFGNNAAGAAQMIEALGRDRVLLGFPGAAGIPSEGVIRYVVLAERDQPTTIGELDGSRSERITAAADALRSAGFPVSISPNIDAWLKTHAAEIAPTAGALYMAGGDIGKLALDRDVLRLMLEAIREGYAVLGASGTPITPSSHRVFRWIPGWLLLKIIPRMLEDPSASIQIGHALAARSEMRQLADELRALAASASIPTPSMDRLFRSIDPEGAPGA